jgi:hypothetical protein
VKIDLDEALRSYVDHPLPPGMERRILRRVGRRRWRWPVLSLVAAGFSCLVLLRPASNPVIKAIPQRQLTVSEARQKPGGTVEDWGTRSSGLSGDQWSGRLRPRSALPPNKAQGPDTVDALWRFAQKHPEEAMQLTVEYQQTPIVPLKFDPIAIDEPETEQ